MIEAQVSVNGKAVSGDNEKTVNQSQVITSTARTYTGEVLTVMERQYLDYIKVLDALVPKNNKTNEEPADSQAATQEESQQSKEEKPKENDEQPQTDQAK